MECGKICSVAQSLLPFYSLSSAAHKRKKLNKAYGQLLPLPGKIPRVGRGSLRPPSPSSRGVMFIITMNGLLRGNAEGRIKGNGSWKALVGQRWQCNSVGNILQGAASAVPECSIHFVISFRGRLWAWSTHFAAFIEASLYGTDGRGGGA